MSTETTREAIWQAALHYQHTVASEYQLKDALAKHEAAVRAEAWDEGQLAGRANEHHTNWDTPITNPYRTKED